MSETTKKPKPTEQLEQEQWLEKWFGARGTRYIPDTPLTEFGQPELISIEPIHSCNLKCRMCHVSNEKMSGKKIDVGLLLERIDKLKGKWVDIGGTYEPLTHPQFPELVQGLTDSDFHINFISNGTLFTEKKVEELRHCRFERVTISFDGASPDSYEWIRPPAKYQRTLERIGSFRDRVENVDYYAINNTLVMENIDEVLDSIDLWESMNFHHVGLIAMVLRGGANIETTQSMMHNVELMGRRLIQAAFKVIEEEKKITISSPRYTEKNPVKDKHPGCFYNNCVKSSNPDAVLPFQPIRFFQNGSFPGMPVLCRSPFKALRISYDGSVYLCQSRFRIGNIYEEDLLDIWYGHNAERIRMLIKSNPKICNSCDYLRFCIQADEISYDDVSMFLDRPILDRKYNVASEPRVLGDAGVFQIWQWMDEYYAVHKGLQISDIRLIEIDNYDDLYVSKSLDGVKKMILEYYHRASGD